MSGTAANAGLWSNADVYIAPFGSTAPTDVDTAWGASWDVVGLLDGEAGFAESREKDSADFYAWGGALIKSTVSKHKRMIKFKALEDNDTVFALVNPGSTRTTALGLTTSDVKVPQAEDIAVGFEVRDGNTVKRRICSRAKVTEVGEVVESETGLTMYEITLTLFPDANDVYYTELKGAV